MASAPLIEIFASIQGEGRFIGVPMAFVRTARCPIRCHYCDTPHGFEVPPHCAVRAAGAPGCEPNPVAGVRAAELAAVLAPRARAGERRVSVTGGEPLLHPEFVAELGAALRDRGLRVHLETAALHPAALRAVAAHVDHLSADYKLPGTLAHGDYRAQHRACIEIGIAAGHSVDVKLVLTRAVEPGAVDAALDELGPFREHVLLILQPVTPFGAVTERADPTVLAHGAAEALARGFAVRMLPQIHPVLGVD